MIRKISLCYRFSNSALNLLSKFDDEFYHDNFLKTFDQRGFPQATIKIADSSVKLIGVPHAGNIKTQLDDLSELLLKDQSQVNFMVQIDPSSYLFTKRQLFKSYHKNIEPLVQQNVFDHLPMMPLDINEARLSMNIFDSLYLLKQGVSGIEQKNQLMQILSAKDAGYFTQIFNKLSALKESGKELTTEIENEANVVQQELADLIQQTILYQDQSNMVDYSKLSLFQALYMTTLKGSNVMLCDLSQIYLRLYSGNLLTLEETKEIFSDICKEAIDQASLPLSQFYEYHTMHWRQMTIEYYLLYSINAYLNTTQAKELTVVVDSLHYDPLRLALSRQEGKYIDEVKNPYFNEFALVVPKTQESDEQMIEKHAILDAISGWKLWQDKCINNPFPYISQNYNSLDKQAQKEVQKIFHRYSTKYESVVKEVNKKFLEAKKQQIQQ